MKFKSFSIILGALFSLLLMSMSDCDAGGVGATSCSISGQVEILGVGTEVSMSVSCGDGYYACCNSDWLTTAKCIANGERPSTTLIGPVKD